MLRIMFSAAIMFKVYRATLFALMIVAVLAGCEKKEHLPGELIFSDRDKILKLSLSNGGLDSVYNSRNGDLVAYPSVNSNGDIAFETCHAQNCEIVLFNSNKKIVVPIRVTSDVYGFPSISPDGKLIAVQMKDAVNNSYKVSVISGPAISEINIPTKGGCIGWSYDNNEITFENVSGKIVVVNVMNKTVKELCNGKSPIFSTDSSKIAYIHNGSVWIYGIHDGSLKVVTNDGIASHFDVLKKWSKDNLHIICGVQRISFSGERYYASALNINTAVVTELTQIYDMQSFDWREF